MLRVVGTDPGTSSLDLLLLVGGSVAGQVRLTPEALHADPAAAVAVLRGWEPLDLVAAPSGYGLPLIRGDALTEEHVEQMSLVRSDERDTRAGVSGFRACVRAFAGSELPVVFLPGGIHLPTIPAHRKVNTIDMGTADKVAVAALATWFDAQTRPGGLTDATFALVELGTVFAAVLVVEQGRLVDASAGTRGPIGFGSGGAWDGEVAYWRSPLTKNDLFRGGLRDLGPIGPAAFRESLIKHVASLRAITPFARIYLSGLSLERPEIVSQVTDALSGFGTVSLLPSLAGAWVKHAAQGAALVADGLAGGQHAALVSTLQLHAATGTVWNGLVSGASPPRTRGSAKD